MRISDWSSDVCSSDLKQTIETGEGEFLETWVMFDSGAIDANGVDRTNSPPFPGLSKSGQVMIASASPPMQQVRIDVTGQFTFHAMTINELGLSVHGGLLGAGVNNRQRAANPANAVPLVEHENRP